MTIYWGSWSSNNRLRAGIEMTMVPATVESDTMTVTITAKVYLQTRYASNENGSSTTWWIYGSLTNSGNTDWSLGDMGYVLMGSKATVFNTSDTGSVYVAATGKIHSYYAYPGTEATSSTSITIPQRPGGGGSAPSSVTATRDSDSQNTVAWTNNGPYDSITVNRQVKVGDTWGDLEVAGEASGDASQLVLGGLYANRIYAYCVQGNVGGDHTACTEASSDVYMTPGVPGSVVSSIDPGGASITTTWVDYAYTDASVTYTVQRSVNSGGFSTVQSGIAQGTTQWQDNSPGAGTNQYQVAAVTSHGPLTSAYAAGNIVSTAVAPNAPTNLSPTGISLDFTQAIVLSWTHNHGGDGASQSAYEIERNIDGGGWSSLTNKVTSATSSATVTGGTWSNGTSVQWRVRTWGIDPAGAGAYSTAATLTGSAAPTTNITAPGSTVTAVPITVTWTYSQGQSSPQASWGVSLYAADGTTLLEHKTGTGTGLTTQFAYLSQDGVSYVVKQQSLSAAGIYSAIDSQSTTVDLPVPAPTDLTPDWRPCTGTMVLTVLAQTPEGAEVAVDHVILERSIDGGAWVVLSSVVPPDTDFIDTLPPLGSTNVRYRATSVSSSPSYLVNDPVTTETPIGTDGQWVFLSYGPGFSTVLRAHGDPKVGDVSDRTREVVPFLGRAKPVLLVGENTSYVISFSGALRYIDNCGPADDCQLDSTPSAWRAAAHEAEIVAYRDYTGRRIFGMVSAINASEVLYPGYATVSFSVTESDYTEAYG